MSNLHHPLSYFGTGKPSSNSISVRLANHSYWDSCLRLFMGVKIMFVLIEASHGLGIIARWGPLPISMVLRSEGRLKSEMLSLSRTSKYIQILVF